MTTQVGTHIDALGHLSNGEMLCNVNKAEDLVTDWGLERLGIENASPMITRGILFDVAGVTGGPHMQPGQTVTVEHLERAAETGGFSVEPGDMAVEVVPNSDDAGAPVRSGRLRGLSDRESGPGRVGGRKDP